MYNWSHRKLLVQRKCAQCNRRTLQCYHCNGETKWQEIDIIVRLGMPPNTKFEYSLSGDGYESIFVTVNMVEVQHKVYKRNGHNLVMELEIYLAEAITHFRKLIKTLDNRTLIVRKSGATREKHKLVVKEEGLPYLQDENYRSGDLIIFCRIKYPPEDFFTNDKINQLKQHLPPAATPSADITDAEECELHSMSATEEIDLRRKFSRTEAEYYKFFPLS